MSGKQLDFGDLLGLISLYIGVQNLQENEQQSAQSLKLLRDNDVQAANDKQAAYILADINANFDEQNTMIRKIMDKLGIQDGD